MNNSPVNVQSSFPTKRLFSKSSVMTLAVTLIILAAAVLGRAITAMIYSQRLSVCNSLYQMFGTDSIPIINIVTGVVTACILVFLAIGLFSARSGANSNPPVTAGLSFLKTGLIVSLVYTALAVIASFASVSVINYSDISGYVNGINFSAAGLFWLTMFFGVAMICCEIAFLRMCSSMIANLQTGAIVKKGAGLTFFASIIGVVTAIVAFCIKLFRLTSPPKDYIKNVLDDKVTQNLNNSEMLINCFNVLIFAAGVVIFVTLLIISGAYAIHSDDIVRAARNGGYNMGHSVVNPEAVTDYTTNQTYNYNQSPTFVPNYVTNKAYEQVNSNIYTGAVPPIPPTPENPFKPKTQYPNGMPVQNAANPNPVYNTNPSVNPNPVYNVNPTVNPNSSVNPAYNANPAANPNSSVNPAYNSNPAANPYPSANPNPVQFQKNSTSKP